MEIEITWEVDRERHKHTEVVWDEYEIIWRINPDRRPTASELSACPKVFRCYCCGDRFPVRKLGGEYHDKRFCHLCIPFIDEWTAGAMVWWETKRHPPHVGKPTASKPNTKLERLESLVAAVRWSRANGYPIR